MFVLRILFFSCIALLSACISTFPIYSSPQTHGEVITHDFLTGGIEDMAASSDDKVYISKHLPTTLVRNSNQIIEYDPYWKTSKFITVGNPNIEPDFDAPKNIELFSTSSGKFTHRGPSAIYVYKDELWTKSIVSQEALHTGVFYELTKTSRGLFSFSQKLEVTHFKQFGPLSFRQGYIYTSLGCDMYKISIQKKSAELLFSGSDIAISKKNNPFGFPNCKHLPIEHLAVSNDNSIYYTGPDLSSFKTTELTDQMKMVLQENNQILVYKNGAVSSFAGSVKKGYKDGPRKEALFDNPTELIVTADNTIYILDRGNHAIRKIDTKGMVSTLIGGKQRGSKDGDLKTAQLDYPQHLTMGSHNTLFVKDANGLREITLPSQR